MNTFAWVILCGVVTGVFLAICKVRPNFWTGAACGIAFCAGIASQHIKLF